jgi:hypothetical protein
MIDLENQIGSQMRVWIKYKKRQTKDLTYGGNLYGQMLDYSDRVKERIFCRVTNPIFCLMSDQISNNAWNHLEFVFKNKQMGNL